MKLIALLLAGVLIAGQALAAADGTVAPAPTTNAADARLNSQVKSLNDGVAARNQARQMAYETQMAQYQARKQSDQDAYAAQLASYNAEVQIQDHQHAVDLAAWRANVAACRKAELSRCERPPAK